MRVMLESEMQEGSDEQHKRSKNGRVLKTILPFPEHLSYTKRIVEMGFKSRGWEQLKEGLSRVCPEDMKACQREPVR